MSPRLGAHSRQETAESSPLVEERYGTLRRLMTDPDHKVVVSMGGGALQGLCGNLALWRILEELELVEHVDELWGTSAGAIIAGGAATGAEALTVLDLVGSLGRRGAIDIGLARFAFRILRSLGPFRRPLPDGVVQGVQFRKTIAAGLKATTFEDCKIPFRCIACSDHGRPVAKVFKSGELLPAIYSSMALPGVMMPMPAGDDGRTWYDGGLVEKTPLRSPIAEHGRSSDGRKLLILATHYISDSVEEPAQGFLRRFLYSLYALEDQLWQYQVREARQRDNVSLLLLDPQIRGVELFAFQDTVPLYVRSRERFADALQDARIISTLGTA